MSTENSLPPVLYKNILYVTDLSESGRKAFPHAASIAQHYNAHLTVFHVVENKELDGLLGYLNDSLWEDLSKRSLEEARAPPARLILRQVAAMRCVHESPSAGFLSAVEQA